MGDMFIDVEPKDVCQKCKDGKHNECPQNMMVVGLRWNMMRCQCDRYGHKLYVKMYEAYKDAESK